MWEHRLHPAFHLSSHTGMRRGEILGLRWCDVDLDAKRLSVVSERLGHANVAFTMAISAVAPGLACSSAAPADRDDRSCAIIALMR